MQYDPWIYPLQVYAEMNSGMHDRLLENSFRENLIIFKNIFFYKNVCSRAQKVI